MRRKERGYSLISTVVAIAIVSMVVAGAGVTSMQVITGTERNEDHSEVVQQGHNLGRWFSRDALMAESIDAGDDPGTGDDELLTIYWKDWESGDDFQIRYLWLDDADSLKLLKRNQVKRDKDDNVTENTTSLIAQSVYSADLSQQDNTWILNLETHSGKKISMQEYRITKRLE